jgi:hypothetical protein
MFQIMQVNIQFIITEQERNMNLNNITFNIMFNIIQIMEIVYTKYSKNKGKAIPLQARRGPKVSRSLRLPVF